MAVLAHIPNAVAVAHRPIWKLASPLMFVRLAVVIAPRVS